MLVMVSMYDLFRVSRSMTKSAAARKLPQPREQKDLQPGKAGSPRGARCSSKVAGGRMRRTCSVRSEARSHSARLWIGARLRVCGEEKQAKGEFKQQPGEAEIEEGETPPGQVLINDEWTNCATQSERIVPSEFGQELQYPGAGARIPRSQ